jgi:hypothetical protein
MPAHRFWVLDDDGEPQPVTIGEWCTWFEVNMDTRQLAHEEVGDYSVSTVFLGLDMSHQQQGPPLLWETMIFGPGDHDGDCWRYSSRLDAIMGHTVAVAMLRVAAERL